MLSRAQTAPRRAGRRSSGLSRKTETDTLALALYLACTALYVENPYEFRDNRYYVYP